MVGAVHLEGLATFLAVKIVQNSTVPLIMRVDLIIPSDLLSNAEVFVSLRLVIVKPVKGDAVLPLGVRQPFQLVLPLEEVFLLKISGVVVYLDVLEGRQGAVTWVKLELLDYVACGILFVALDLLGNDEPLLASLVNSSCCHKVICG